VVVVNISSKEPCKQQPKAPETFEFLVFHRDGCISLQTNRSTYFYANSYYYAARDLNKLLKGVTVKLEYGHPEHRITDPDTVAESKVCVLPDKIHEALDADQVTSNWPGVVKFFTVLKGIETASPPGWPPTN